MAETLTLIEKTVRMKSAQVFEAIPTEPLAQLAARAVEVYVNRGDTIFREGDDDQGIYIVIDGHVELRKGDAVVRVLENGAVHGELFLQEDESHQYTAVAREDTHLLNLARHAVFDALLEYPEFGVAMVQHLALRNHKLTERVIELEHQSTSGAGKGDERLGNQAIETSAPAPGLPKRRGWWRLAARAGAKPPTTGR